MEDNDKVTEGVAQAWQCPALLVKLIKIAEFNKRDEDGDIQLSMATSSDICKLIKPANRELPECACTNASIIILSFISIILSLVILVTLILTRTKMIFKLIHLKICHHDDIYFEPNHLPVEVPAPLSKHVIKLSKVNNLTELASGNFGVVSKGCIDYKLNDDAKIKIEVAIKKLSEFLLVIFVIFYIFKMNDLVISLKFIKLFDISFQSSE